MVQAPLNIEGQRISLRSFGQADLTADYVAWLNDPLVVRYSNQRFTQHSKESCARFLESFESSSNFFFSVRMKESGKAIGTMTTYLCPAHGTADMGILVGARSVWGQGLGLDAWCTLQQWLLIEKKVRKVTAGTLSCNAAMLQLIRKSGMSHEGTRYRQEIVEKVEQDIMYFARFAHD